MKILSKSAKDKLGLTKTAAFGFMPLHHTQESYQQSSASGTQAKQQSIMDIVFREQDSQGFSPLLEMFLKQTQDSNKYVSASDKQLLIKAWETSKSITKAENSHGNRLLISKEFSSTELNQLKAAGLISGSGSEIVLTAKGRETLVKEFLDDGDDDASLTKAAANIVKIVKMAAAEENSNEAFMERASQVQDMFNQNGLELDLGNGYKLVKDPRTGKLVKFPVGK